jgi:simple sugar transport system ATP-binding protein
MVAQGESGAALVEVRGLSKHYGGVAAVENVSLAFPAGAVVALAGDNGAGKSTLVKMICGAVAPTAGEMLIDGAAVRLKSAADAREHGIEMVYQDLALCPDLTAAQNMYLGREPVRWRIGGFGLIDSKRLLRGAEEHFAQLSSSPPAHVPVRNLSGGQRQVIAISRAAFWARRLVIFDEPTAALGVAQRARTLELIRQVAEQGLAVIVISHAVEDIFQVADRITVMRQGRVVTEAPTATLDAGRVRALMGGAA